MRQGKERQKLQSKGRSKCRVYLCHSAQCSDNTIDLRLVNRGEIVGHDDRVHQQTGTLGGSNGHTARVWSGTGLIILLAATKPRVTRQPTDLLYVGDLAVGEGDLEVLVDVDLLGAEIDDLFGLALDGGDFVEGLAE